MTDKSPGPAGGLDSFRALRATAIEARRRGDQLAALEQFSAAASLKPDDALIQNEIASAALALGRVEEAQIAYAAAVALRPNLVDAIRGLGHCARNRHDHAAALAHFEYCATLTDDPRVRIEVARERVALGKPPELAYREMLGDARTRAHACTELAEAARREGNFEAARVWLGRASSADPRDTACRLALGELDLRCWRLDEARVAFDHVLATDPGNAAALLGKAVCARNVGRREDACTFFEAAFQANPKLAAVEFARELRERGDYHRARDVLEEGRAAHLDHAAIDVQLGLVARAEGVPQRAIHHFAAAISSAPRHASAYVEMAVDLRALCRLDEARTTLELAASLFPAHPRVLEAQGDAALAADAVATALDRFTLAAAADVANVGLRLKIARCQAALGRLDSSRATLEAVRASRGASPDAILAKAQILKDAGRLPETAAEYAAGREAFPGTFQLWFQAATFDTDWQAFPRDGLFADVPTPTTPAEHAKLKVVYGARAAARRDFASAQAWFEDAHRDASTDGGVCFRLAQAALANLDIGVAERSLLDLSRIEAPMRRLRGQATGPLKSLLGQIIEEAQLDRDALEGLVEIRMTAPAGHLNGYRRMVRDHPGMTLAAIQLMLALRRDGALQPAAEGAASAIPMSIVQFWHAPDVPDDVAVLCATWRDLNPAFRYRMFAEQDAGALLETECAPNVARAFRRAREPAIKADLFRLAYLTRFGGFYADADDRCLAPVDSLLKGDISLLLYQEDIGSIGNNVMAAAQDNPILLQALEQAADAILAGDSDIAWLSTGPGLLTRVLGKAVALNGASCLGTQSVRILERRDLLATIAPGCMTAYKHTPRHWSRSAFSPPDPAKLASGSRRVPIVHHQT